MSVGPIFDVVDPAVGNEPKITVREEVFGHLLYFRVVSNFFFEEVFTGVILFGVSNRVLEGFINHNNLLGNLSVLIFLVVSVELGNRPA